MLVWSVYNVVILDHVPRVGIYGILSSTSCMYNINILLDVFRSIEKTNRYSHAEFGTCKLLVLHKRSFTHMYRLINVPKFDRAYYTILALLSAIRNNNYFRNALGR